MERKIPFIHDRHTVRCNSFFNSKLVIADDHGLSTWEVRSVIIESTAFAGILDMLGTNRAVYSTAYHTIYI